MVDRSIVDMLTEVNTGQRMLTKVNTSTVDRSTVDRSRVNRMMVEG
jgi:hypothetical protein